MEGLVGGILFIIFITWLIGPGIDFVVNQQSEFAQHIWAWKELYILIVFITYLVIIRLLTEKVFNEVSHHQPNERTETMLSVIGQFITRPIVFFIVTVLILFRSQYLLIAVHYNELDSLAPIFLATTFGVIFAFWPTTTLKSFTYSAFLAQLRALYLIVATIISIIYLSIAFVVSTVIILIPIGIYIALAFAAHQYIGEPISFRNTMHTIIIIGGIAAFIMTARGTWNLSRYVINNYARSIKNIGIKILESWTQLCQRMYTPVSIIPLRVGAFLGGDAR